MSCGSIFLNCAPLWDALSALHDAQESEKQNTNSSCRRQFERYRAGVHNYARPGQDLPNSLPSQTVCHNTVYERAEHHSDVRGGDLNVHRRVARSADTPVQDPVIPGIDSGLPYRTREIFSQRLEKITGAAGRVTAGQHATAMFFQNLLSHQFSDAQDRSMADNPADGRSQRNHRSNAIRHLRRGGQRDGATQAVSDEMNFAPTRFAGLLDRLVHMSPN